MTKPFLLFEQVFIHNQPPDEDGKVVVAGRLFCYDQASDPNRQLAWTICWCRVILLIRVMMTTLRQLLKTRDATIKGPGAVIVKYSSVNRK